MATEHRDNIFSSGVPKEKAGIQFIFVNKETLQQNITNNMSASLCKAPEGEPSDEEEMPDVQCDQGK